MSDATVTVCVITAERPDPVLTVLEEVVCVVFGEDEAQKSCAELADEWEGWKLGYVSDIALYGMPKDPTS